MTTIETEKVQSALAWMVEILHRHNVPYQVVGGLAAKAYGAQRPLFDIDMYVPFDRATGVLEEIAPYITWGPEHYVDDSWDITFLKIDYAGQRIEFGDSSTHPCFFKRKDQRWEEQVIDYANSVCVDIFGIAVSVMPKEELVRYKSALGREVDVLDIEHISRQGA